MDGTIIDNDAPTLETVNINLLSKLNNAILSVDSADSNTLLNLTEAVAKLNTSSKNNDKLSKPLSDKEKVDKSVSAMFSSLGEGQVVNA